MSAPVGVGDHAPSFELLDDTGAPVRLADFAGRKVVLYFYPAAMTPGCTTQALDFTADAAAFTGAGYAVVGVSPDPPAKLAKFRAKENLGITLLSDPERTVLTAYGAFGEKTMYGKKVTGVIRSTFVIDESGVIAVAQRNVRATGHVAKLARELGIAVADG